MNAIRNLSVLVLVIFGTVRAGDDLLTIRHGPWELKVESTSGAWSSLKWNGGNIMADNAQASPSVDLALSSKLDKWLSQTGSHKLIGHNWDDSKAILSLRLKCEEWELVEFIQFGALGNPNRIARSAHVTYSPKSGDKSEPAKFYKIRFNTYLPKTGRYFFPAVFPGSITEEKSSFGKCQNITRVMEGNTWKGNIAPVLIEQAAQRSLLFISEGRRDRFGLAISPQGKRLVVKPAFLFQGWAMPGITQEVGPTYMEIHEKDIRSTLREAIWTFYDDTGLKVPTDRPEWIYDSSLYAFHPGGSAGSGWKDLGGFTAARKELIPRVVQLGFGALWSLPVEELWVYRPCDYYKFAPNLGSKIEYRELIDAAHEAGLKFLQDNVPHGGTPEFGPIRGNSPFSLLFNEEGDALNYWCWDFRDPEWQSYIREVVSHYVKNFDIDGYRIDACGGSKMTNWRRKGFPKADHTPENVPENWWRESLATAGGVVPELPYERGSMALRQGGMQMVHAIREEVKKIKPHEGAILGEVGGIPYMQECDIVYDFKLAHSILLRYREMSPAKFATALSTWLEEQKFSEPRGTFRLRYIGSHDTLRSKGWVGRNASRALRAVTFWIHGMPLVYHDSDLGDGIFLRRLNEVRKALPEMRRGVAEYQAVNCAPKEVFAVLRKYNSMISVALVNLGGKNLTCTGKIPANHLRALGKEEFILWDSWTGKKLAKGRLEELADFQINLEPWGTAVLTFRAIAEACPAPIMEDKEPTKDITIASETKKPILWEEENTLNVSGKNYSFGIDREKGLPKSFTVYGKQLMGSGKLLINKANAKYGKNVTITNQFVDDELHILSRIPVGTTGAVELLYRCSEKDVKIEAKLCGQIAEKQIGLALSALDVSRYQIETVEGCLDDFFEIRHKLGKPGRGSPYYRMQGTPIIWQSETKPLDPRHPEIRAFDNSGSGIEFEIAEPISNDLDNIQITDELDGQQGLNAIFFWRQSGFIYNSDKKTGEKFALTLRPTSINKNNSANTNKTSSNAAAGNIRTNSSLVKLGDVKLTNDSRGWVVENNHYRVRLLRCGGAMQELWSLKDTPRMVLKKQEVYTDKGFIPANVKRKFKASIRNDGETGVRFWLEGGTLHMRFCSQMRGSHKWGNLLRPAVWVITEYAFDDSPKLHFSCKIMSDGGLHTDKAFLAWVAENPEWENIIMLKESREMAQGIFKSDVRSAEVKNMQGNILPDELQILDGSGKMMVSIRNLKFNSPELPNNIFVHGKRLFIARLDGNKERFHAKQWYQVSMTIIAAYP